jgi:uncharacterized protein
MQEIKPWLALIVASIGNCGFWLFCFNRVNAFGIPRKIAKLLEKVCIASCFAIPAVVLWSNRLDLIEWLTSSQWLPGSTRPWFTFWLYWSLGSVIFLGPLWLESRRWLVAPKHLLDETTTARVNVHTLIAGGSAQNFSTKCLALLPLNEWAHISITQKSLMLPRSIPAADGLKIGHLSDLHFTGQYRVEHYQYVIQQFQQLQPELIVISGDIIDYARCLPMIKPALAGLSAPLGVHFVLGNHDKRLKDIQPLLAELNGLGFHDLGVADRIIQRGSLSLLLTGNERPWFERHANRADKLTSNSLQEQALRVAVVHTPDAIHWARRLNIDLVLAGHTHGGQVRIPMIGPLVAPSNYGSKFASGVFYLKPTLMHVSRGIAGTHPLRWRCPPEVSLLTLVSPVGSAED